MFFPDFGRTGPSKSVSRYAMRLPLTLATESRAVPARSEALRTARLGGSACVGRCVARADGHDVEGCVRRGRVALSPHWAPAPFWRTAAHAGDAGGPLLGLASDRAARDLPLEAPPSPDVFAARQLVPDPSAEVDAVVNGPGGQPQLVQHAPVQARSCTINPRRNGIGRLEPWSSRSTTLTKVPELSTRKVLLKYILNGVASPARPAAARAFRLSAGLLVRLIVAVGLLMPCVQAQDADPGGGIGYADYPEAEQWAEDIASEYATESGNQDLADAIAAGDVNVYPGNVPHGPAMSWRGLPGNPHTIVVQQTPNGEWIGVACVHEWLHLTEDDPVEPDCEPTDAEKKRIACDECEAHFKALLSMYVRQVETGLKISCAVKFQVVQDMRA